jgi:hypothetical protein
MDLLQFGWRTPRSFIPLIAFDLVWDVELFQKPKNALRARIVELMDNNHGLVPSDSFEFHTSCSNATMLALASPSIARQANTHQ